MPFIESDRLLWVTVLIGLSTAYFSIPRLLNRVKDASRAPPLDAAVAPARQLQKDSENSLKIETLRTLVDGHSFDIRTSAIKIVASRTVRSETVKKLLLRDLASDDFDRRDNAINSLSMLLWHPALDGGISSAFNSVAAIDAVISALIHMLPLHQRNSNGRTNVDDSDKNNGESNDKGITNNMKNPQSRPSRPSRRILPPSPLRPLHRPSHETALLKILTTILRQVTMGVDASGADLSPVIRRMITDWLAHYPFPCSLPEYANFNYKKRDVMRLFILMPGEDPVMAEIFKELQKYSGLLRPLRDAGLLGHPPMSDYSSGGCRQYQWNVQPWFDEDNDVHMTDGEDTAGEASGGEVGTTGSAAGSAADVDSGGDRDGEGDHTNHGGDTPSWSLGPTAARAGERSLEEEHLRRRHRQAIVVAERGTPLSRDNILQREDSRVGLQPMASGSAEGEGELNHLLDLSQDQEEHTGTSSERAALLGTSHRT
ncbi:hypothetical protein PV10_07557 [Exophiala mesophila]|uniref:Uncharacterized protein n=1 Tax=Exophiala mesophila TaxID=212818 RepID=A0A0D1Z867_EXOME|nr:uncharacterized protein PV10_07557 [Exophiala mesophila]KIV90229.1 hypothetical protein PV10_07557 [Exophiala mesophila]